MAELKILPQGAEASGAKVPNPPAHLSAKARKLWRKIADEGGVHDTAGQVILTAAMEAFDRMKSAQEMITLHGVTTPDRFGQLKQNPAVQVERDARAGLFNGLRILGVKELPEDQMQSELWHEARA